MGAFDAPTGTALGWNIFVSKKAIIIRLKMGFHKIKPKLQRNWLREILRYAVLLQIFSVYLV